MPLVRPLAESTGHSPNQGHSPLTLWNDSGGAEPRLTSGGEAVPNHSHSSKKSVEPNAMFWTDRKLCLDRSKLRSKATFELLRTNPPTYSGKGFARTPAMSSFRPASEPL